MGEEVGLWRAYCVCEWSALDQFILGECNIGGWLFVAVPPCIACRVRKLMFVILNSSDSRYLFAVLLAVVIAQCNISLALRRDRGRGAKVVMIADQDLDACMNARYKFKAVLAARSADCAERHTGTYY